jgi:FkbM family methyltransferase
MYKERIKTTCECRDCDKLEKVDNGGMIVIENNDKIQYMFNGVKIYYDSYHSPWMNEIIKNLKGHHEPQEELCFYYILKLLNNDANMLELGCAWCYYSMFFRNKVVNGTNICIEPNIEKLKKGKKNVDLNNLSNFTYIHGYIGKNYIENDKFVDWDGSIFNISQYNISSIIKQNNNIFLDVIHSDIQGAEVDMLNGSIDALDNIGFFVISTHDDCHQKCINFLNNNNFSILVQHTIEESYSADGLIISVNNKHINKYENKLNNLSLKEYFDNNCNISKRKI